MADWLTVGLLLYLLSLCVFVCVHIWCACELLSSQASFQGCVHIRVSVCVWLSLPHSRWSCHTNVVCPYSWQQCRRRLAQILYLYRTHSSTTATHSCMLLILPSFLAHSLSSMTTTIPPKPRIHMFIHTSHTWECCVVSELQFRRWHCLRGRNMRLVGDSNPMCQIWRSAN